MTRTTARKLYGFLLIVGALCFIALTYQAFTGPPYDIPDAYTWYGAPWWAGLALLGVWFVCWLICGVLLFSLGKAPWWLHLLGLAAYVFAIAKIVGEFPQVSFDLSWPAIGSFYVVYLVPTIQVLDMAFGLIPGTPRHSRLRTEP